MSQVARAKKMFDDISSDAESKVSEPAVTTVVPAVASYEAAATPTADTDPNAFAPKSASASQARPEQPEAGEEQEEVELPPSGNNMAETMVTRVDVSPPPREAPLSKPPPASSATARTLAIPAAAAAASTPHKAAGAKSTATSAGGGAPSSSLSTPATVSKRPAAREEREAAAAAAGSAASSAVRPEKAGTSATKGSRYQEGEAAAFSSTVANRGESRTSRQRRAGEATDAPADGPYAAQSGRKGTAAQLDYSREEPMEERAKTQKHGGDRAALLRGAATDDEDSEVEDFPFSTYVFPRLDPALADYQGSRTAVGAAKRGEECPPNACERCFAYLMVTDIRLAVYLGVLILCLVFVIVSIPTSQLDMVGKSCFTYWGFKADCDTATYTVTRPLYTCSAIRSRLGAGAAFSIITLVIYVVNLTATIIAVCCLKTSPHKISLTSRVVVGAVGGVIVITQLISWAVIAGIHSSHYCFDKGVLAFGVGFGLNLTAWILNFLGVVLVVAIPSQLVNHH